MRPPADEADDGDNYVTASSRLGDEFSRRAAAPRHLAQPDGTPAHAYYPLDALETLAGGQQQQHKTAPSGETRAVATGGGVAQLGVGAPMLAQAAQAAVAQTDGTKRLYLSILLACIILLCLLLYLFADLEINVIDMGAGNDNLKLHSDD